jgi:hypothetical protein
VFPRNLGTTASIVGVEIRLLVLKRSFHPLVSLMRSRLAKESPPGLLRTNPADLAPRPRFRARRFKIPPAARTSLVVLFAFFGLSLVIYSGLRRFRHSHSPATVNSILSRFTSKPPLVDRTILETIASLDLSEDEANSESGTDLSIPINIKSSYVLSSFHRLPRVTHIPEVQPQAPPVNHEMEMQNRWCSEGNVDRTTPSCKFLLPLKIAGQGTNAHVHLVQLLELARALNRTLVLPNVGKDRLGTCRRWRFGVYYDEQALSDELKGDPNAIVQQDGFRAWVDSLASPPSSQLVFLDRTYPKGFPPTAVSGQIDGSPGVYTHNDSDAAAVLYSQAGCLNRKLPRLDLIGLFPPLSFVVGDRRKQESNGDEISQILLGKLSELTLTHAQSESAMETYNHSIYGSNPAHVSPDVLIVSWNIPTPIFQPYPIPVLRYSPQLRALATRLARRLGPHIAVAWDVDTSKVDAVLGCVEALRSTLHYMLSSYERLGIRNIWLAGNLLPSDLVHSPEPFCTNTFAGSFFTSDVKLTGVRQELARMIKEGEEIDEVANNGDGAARKQALEDSGVLGILDKLVSMRSTIFVTASKRCGKTRRVFPSPVSKDR